MAAEVKEILATAVSKPRVVITSDKFKQEFHVDPSPGGFVFYAISTTTGKLPRELEGRYTRMKYAVDAVLDYERRSKNSVAVDMDIKREKRNASKLQRERAELIHEGSDNGTESTDVS